MPTHSTDSGIYTIQVVFDPTNGSDVSYSALTVIVEYDTALMDAFSVVGGVAFVVVMFAYVFM